MKQRNPIALVIALAWLVGASRPIACASDYGYKILYELPTTTSLAGVQAPGLSAGASTVNGHYAATYWNAAGVPTVLDSSTLPSLTDFTLNQLGSSFAVGDGGTGINQDHAVVWNLSTGVATDLHPDGFVASLAVAVSGNQQVGYARTTFPGSSKPLFHAMLWNGTAASVQDLTPTSIPGSQYSPIQATAWATDGTHQVGDANEFAGYWSGNAASFQSLGPTNLPNLSSARALGLSGTQIVGYAITTDQNNHPLLWNSVGTEPLDLMPSGFTSARLRATNGVEQVGDAEVGPLGQMRAMVWSGIADSAVNLHSLLPEQYVSSAATAIDGDGNIFGVAYDVSGNYFITEWSAVPEPVIVPLAAAMLLALRRKRDLSQR